MDPRFITRNMHAYLDYPVAVALMTMPIILQVGSSHPMAKWLSIATGFAALLLTLLTDHKFGVIRVIPYRGHLAVDFLVGLSFAAAPFIFGFTGLDAWYYWLNAAAVLTVVTLGEPAGLDANRWQRA
ncbi:MAG: hypothetical protein KJ622_07110 [Alphaproteobacteria bacterium]|nr:hypothetical protein [Alphaproteobacteria bacterium]